MLALAKAHQLVVEVDRCQRLDEQGRPGRRRGVDDAAHRLGGVGADGHDEATVSLGDELVADERLGVRSADHALQHAAQPRANPRDTASDPFELDTGVIQQSPVGGNGVHHLPGLGPPDRERRPDLVQVRVVLGGQPPQALGEVVGGRQDRRQETTWNQSPRSELLPRGLAVQPGVINAFGRWGQTRLRWKG